MHLLTSFPGRTTVSFVAYCCSNQCLRTFDLQGWRHFLHPGHVRSVAVAAFPEGDGWRLVICVDLERSAWISAGAPCPKGQYQEPQSSSLCGCLVGPMMETQRFKHFKDSNLHDVPESIQLGGLYSCVCVVGVKILTTMGKPRTYVLIQLALSRN